MGAGVEVWEISEVTRKRVFLRMKKDIRVGG
jgi:hypothetical protein